VDTVGGCCEEWSDIFVLSYPWTLQTANCGTEKEIAPAPGGGRRMRKEEEGAGK